MTKYDIAYSLAAPVFYANAMWKRWRKGKYKQSLPGMFGANLPRPPLAPAATERVWIHSVSVGETIGAAAFFRALKARHPDWEILSTTGTETGQAQARRSLAGANYFDFAPADFSWNVARFLDAYKPTIYCFMETEIWPNTLLECGKRGIRTFLVNGDLSERSSRNYAKLRPLFAGPLSNVHAYLVQTEEDARRYRAIAGPDARIEVTGNVKFDNLPKPLTAEDRAARRAAFGASPSDVVILAGSTHPTEERIVWDAFSAARVEFPNLRLVLCPRHPERFTHVAEELTQLGAKVHRTSAPEATDPRLCDVVLLDQMGVLAASFGAADIGIVGGAWNPIGGHNLLEPAAHGIPVVHGPHMHEQREIMRIMQDHQASVPTVPEVLSATLLDLARSPEERRKMGARGQAAAQENAGAAGRSVDFIEAFLSPAAR